MGQILTAGTRAPEFTLRGSPIILAFYPADWSTAAAIR
jgi:hypothetical protein